MKRRHAYITVIAVTLAVFAYGGVSALAEPGAPDDPLVSKSYVDNQINIVKALIGGGGQTGAAERNAIIAEVLAYIDTVYGEALRASGGGSNEFVVVRADRGQTYIGYAGTEIILRSGTAVAVTGENGLSDITAGADIINGMSIARNHLLIVPLSDGRGLYCTSDDVYLMIKGGYYIVQ